MKNRFILLSLALIFSLFSVAQKKSKPTATQLTIPENVNTSFKSLYANAEGSTWNRNYSGNYIASFTNGDTLKQSAEFSTTGAMVKSRTEYSPNGLPPQITSAISAQYPDVKMLEAARLQMPGVAPYYKVKIETSEKMKKELLISEEGTITE